MCIATHLGTFTEIMYLHILRTRHDVRVWVDVGIKWKTCAKWAYGSCIDAMSCRLNNCVYYPDGKRKAPCTHLYQKFQFPSPPNPTIISERQHAEKVCLSVMVCISAQINSLKRKWMV